MSVGHKISKLEDWKKICSLAGNEPHTGSLSLSLGQWDHPQSLMDCNFSAIWLAETQSTALERSKPLLKHTFDS